MPCGCVRVFLIETKPIRIEIFHLKMIPFYLHRVRVHIYRAAMVQSNSTTDQRNLYRLPHTFHVFSGSVTLEGSTGRNAEQEKMARKKKEEESAFAGAGKQV